MAGGLNLLSEQLSAYSVIAGFTLMMAHTVFSRYAEQLSASRSIPAVVFRVPHGNWRGGCEVEQDHESQ